MHTFAHSAHLAHAPAHCTSTWRCSLRSCGRGKTPLIVQVTLEVQTLCGAYNVGARSSLVHLSPHQAETVVHLLRFRQLLRGSPRNLRQRILHLEHREAHVPLEFSRTPQDGTMLQKFFFCVQRPSQVVTFLGHIELDFQRCLDVQGGRECSRRQCNDHETSTWHGKFDQARKQDPDAQR